MSAEPTPRKASEVGALMEIVTPYLNARSLSANAALLAVSSSQAGDLMARKEHDARVSNSTSSIYVKSTVSRPDVIEVLQSISSVLHCIIHQGSVASDQPAPATTGVLQIFDERVYVPGRSGKRLRWDDSSTSDSVPPPEIVFAFLKACVDRAAFSIECMVIALVLLNRLLAVSSLPIVVHAFNWRLLFLTSILIAQKIWDDASLANNDFPVVWRYAAKVTDDFLDVTAFCDMEAKMLELLAFNLYIAPSLYTQYIFELRTVHESQFTSAFPIPPLSAAEAAFLESRSNVSPDELRNRIKLQSKSVLDAGQHVGSRGRAVIS
jgi:hypothetical protein